MNGPELRDIHLPATVSAWPPAPGWWLLALLLAIAAALAWLYWQRRRRRTLAALALDELARIRAGLDSGEAEQAAINALAGLLRRLLISYRGRDGYADSTGDAWVAQLRELSAAGFSDAQFALLGHARYRRDATADVAALLDAGEHWVRSLPREVPRAAA